MTRSILFYLWFDLFIPFLAHFASFFSVSIFLHAFIFFFPSPYFFSSSSLIRISLNPPFSLHLHFSPFPLSSSRLYLYLLLLCIRSLSQGSTNSNILDVQGGAHKKRVRRSSLLNAKKLYEDAQMARKVKQYLSNLTVETDEDRHQIMSLQCEPSYNTCELNRDQNV